MNVYHKILVKIFEITGGKESMDVDLIDLTKKEGYFPNIDMINKQLLDEGWITEPSRKYTIRITHWGATEAKRVISDSPDRVNELLRNSTRLVNETKELASMVEEIAAKPESGKLDLIARRIADLSSRVGTIRQHL